MLEKFTSGYSLKPITFLLQTLLFASFIQNFYIVEKSYESQEPFVYMPWFFIM